MTPEELIAYFKDKELPAKLSLPGQTIANCRTYVDANILRIKEGVLLIASVSFNHLVRLKEALQLEGQSSALS
ncbi:MAG: DUF6965 family protein [Agriterribacter sp.]